VCACVQLSHLESDVDEKKRRRRRKYEDETSTSDDADDDESADDDEDRQQVRRPRGRARKSLVRGFSAPEIRRLIKSMRKFARPLDRYSQ